MTDIYESLEDRSHVSDYAVLDVDEYREELAGLNLSPAQEKELLSTIWEIMKSFVALGFGTDSLSLILPEVFNETCQSDEHMLSQGDEGDDQKGTSS